MGATIITTIIIINNYSNSNNNNNSNSNRSKMMTYIGHYKKVYKKKNFDIFVTLKLLVLVLPLPALLIRCGVPLPFEPVKRHFFVQKQTPKDIRVGRKIRRAKRYKNNDGTKKCRIVPKCRNKVLAVVERS